MLGLFVKGGVTVTMDYEKKGTFSDAQKEQRIHEVLDQLKQRQRTKAIDTSRTIEQITFAIGPRTNAEFADLIGESPMKISRLRSGNTVTLKPEIIAKIIVFAYPDGDFSSERLLEAQGFVDPSARRFKGTQFEDICRKTISDALLKQNKYVRYKDVPDNLYFGDFSIITDALTGEQQEWLFECRMTGAHLRENSHLFCVTSTRDLLCRAMSMYFFGKTYGRLSLIVDRETTFNHLKEEMSECHFPYEISIILIVDDEIIDEYIIPLTDGREAVSLFEKHRQDK